MLVQGHGCTASIGAGGAGLGLHTFAAGASLVGSKTCLGTKIDRQGGLRGVGCERWRVVVIGIDAGQSANA